MNFIDISKYKEAKKETELGKMTKELLVAHLDQRKKEEWAKELDTKYGVAKKNKFFSLKTNRITRLRRWSVAATILLILAALPFLLPSVLQTPTQQLVAEYASHPYSLDNDRKGTTSSIDLRAKRDNAYQEKKYREAIKLNKTLIAKKNADNNDRNNDYLIQGMCYFNTQNWPEAISHLEEILPKYKNSNRINDIRWYLSLAYYSNHQEKEASEIWKELEKKKSSIYAEQATKLLTLVKS